MSRARPDEDKADFTLSYGVTGRWLIYGTYEDLTDALRKAEATGAVIQKGEVMELNKTYRATHLPQCSAILVNELKQAAEESNRLEREMRLNNASPADLAGVMRDMLRMLNDLHEGQGWDQLHCQLEDVTEAARELGVVLEDD